MPKCQVAQVYVPPECYAVAHGSSLDVYCAKKVIVNNEVRTKTWTVHYTCAEVAK